MTTEPAARRWRVLHVLDHGPPARDGYVTRSLGIAEAQRGFGWDPVLFTGPRQPGGPAVACETIEGWSLHRGPAPRWTRHLPGGPRAGIEMAAAAARLAALARRLRPDILHAHSPALNVLPALAVGRALGIPVVYEVRAFWEDAAAEQGRGAVGSPRWRAIRALDTWLFRRVAAVTTICTGLRDDILARGIAPERLTIVPNGVDTAHLTPLPPPDQAARHALGLPPCRTLIGFIGSLYGYEGIDLLVAAAARLLPERPELAFAVVGGGPAEARLRARVAALGLGPRFRMLGRVPHRDIAGCYAAMDALVYPRRALRLTECVTPLKPLEAMAQGRVVLASDVGGHRELIKDGRTGILFPPDDVAALTQALRVALDTPSGWPSLRDTALRFVRAERSWEAVARRYAGVYAAAAR